ncbi:Bug family tripartite tricarboxylate transporter substrate binding protein [Paracoccus ravus]|uniref:Bug family tripartite tricarboxylate transporter substrate binding protein n=1 Tax=Paracoccus ravus TaxID=2447760 RepID=UPI00106E1993|nr:tripartite tricarboxylate transporter substrate-binding protein [Paracoccus ravus]
MTYLRSGLASAWLMAAAAILPLSSAHAEDLEISIIAPAGAGGGWDSAARSLQDVMMKTGNAHSVQVMNVPGAGGTVGLAQFVQGAKGSPDQMLVGGITMVGAIITNKAPYNLSNVTPIARLTGDPLVVVVPASSPYKTMADLMEGIKKDVAHTIWAGGSAGGADHILAALVTQAAGVDPAKVNYVAYSGGGESLAAMLGGQVTAGVSGYGEWQGQIESGDLRALAISYPEPIEGIAAQPLKAQGIDVELVNWRGIFAGPELADADKAVLETAVQKTVESPEWKELIKAKGWSDYYAPSAEFTSFIASEDARVHGVLKSIGLAE